MRACGTRRRSISSIQSPESNLIEARVSREAANHAGWFAGVAAVRTDYDQTRAWIGSDRSEPEFPGLHNRQSEVAVFGELTDPCSADRRSPPVLARRAARSAAECFNSRQGTATESRKQDFFLPSITFSGRPAPALIIWPISAGLSRRRILDLRRPRSSFGPDRMSAIEFGGRYARKRCVEPRIDGARIYTLDRRPGRHARYQRLAGDRHRR